jgi:hypothetical protein
MTDGETGCVGFVLGVFAATIILAALIPSCEQKRIDAEWSKKAIESGVGRYHPSTGKFEFLPPTETAEKAE